MKTSEIQINETTCAQIKPTKTTVRIFHLFIKHLWISITLLFSFLLTTSYVNEENAMYDLKNEYYSQEMHVGIAQRLDINGSMLTSEKLILKSQVLIKEFYNENQFSSIWTLNQNPSASTLQLLQLLKNANYYGLDKKFYHYDKLTWLLDRIQNTNRTDSLLMYRQDFDILLTDACFLFMIHLNTGIVELDTIVNEKTTRALSAYLNKIIRNNELIDKILALQPTSPDYRNLQKALENFASKNTIDDVHMEIPDPEKDSLNSYNNTKKVLTRLGYLTQELTDNDSAFNAALTAFQNFHGLKTDGRLTKNTRLALAMSTKERFLMIALALDKLRKDMQYGNDFILVNIPSYQLRVIRNHKIDKTFNVVVGRPSTPTPELNSKLESIVTAPEWNVPKTITVNEILPHVKKDSSYLVRNNFKIIDKQLNDVDMNTIAWNDMNGDNFDYYFVQNSGASNALGLVKFSFNNPYRVYIHDTPSKKYFNADIRAFSHGCIRLQNPDQLATYLVDNNVDGNQKPDISKLMASKTHQEISLSEPIDIYIRYLTCEADDHLNLYFYKDIYNKDSKLIQSLFN